METSASSQRLADAEVIVASNAEPRRFEAIFDRHHNAVHGYIRRRVGMTHADDLAAEVFVLAFERRARFDQSASSARPWLLGIATNLMRHHWRRERRQLRAYARSGIDPLALGFEAEAVARLDATMQHKELAGALADLSKRDRDVLLLSAWGGLEPHEIAVALDIEPGTARSRLFRSRRQMRERLSSSGQ